MPMRPLILAVLPAVFLAMPLAAQDLDCANSETQIEMTACAEQDWRAADADLNDAYKSALAMMQEYDMALPKAQQGAAAHLRDAQRAWITFRDETCSAEGYQVHGGSMEPMVIYGCQARITADRAEDLWAMAAGDPN